MAEHGNFQPEEPRGAPDKRKPPPLLREMNGLVLAYQFIGEVVVLALLGLWCDYRWGLIPWCTLIGLGCGLMIGFYQLFRASQNQR